MSGLCRATRPARAHLAEVTARVCSATWALDESVADERQGVPPAAAQKRSKGGEVSGNAAGTRGFPWVRTSTRPELAGLRSWKNVRRRNLGARGGIRCIRALIRAAQMEITVKTSREQGAAGG